MSNWAYTNDEPTFPWRGVQSLPREVALRQTPDGIRLVQAPIRELATLRASLEPATVTTGAALPGGAEIELDVQAGDWSEAGFRLSNSAGEEVIVGVRAQPLEVFVHRHGRARRRSTMRTPAGTPRQRDVEWPGRAPSDLRPHDARGLCQRRRNRPLRTRLPDAPVQSHRGTAPRAPPRPRRYGCGHSSKC